MRDSPESIRLALPKGRMAGAVEVLLAEAGLAVKSSVRAYRPRLPLDGFEVKQLKPQSIVEMLDHGSRDLGFTGADWLDELGGGAAELLDTGLDPVRVIAAAPERLLEDGRLPARRLTVASEYPTITRRWIKAEGIDADFVKSFGATEVYPPEDADCIVDNTATGATLAANELVIVAELMRSSTRLCASRAALADPDKRTRIEDFVLLVRSVLEARRRVMVEINVAADRLEAVAASLPCMREPTVAQLHGSRGFAIKVAVPREVLPELIPAIKERGGRDIIVTTPAQIVP